MRVLMSILLIFLSFLPGLSNADTNISELPLVSQTSSRLVVVQVHNDDYKKIGDPLLLEFGILRIKLNVQESSKIISKVILPRITVVGSEIVIENPDVSKPLEFKLDTIATSVVWALHEKKMTPAPIVFFEGDSTGYLVDQADDISIELYYVGPYLGEPERPLK